MLFSAGPFQNNKGKVRGGADSRRFGMDFFRSPARSMEHPWRDQLSTGWYQTQPRIGPSHTRLSDIRLNFSSAIWYPLLWEMGLESRGGHSWRHLKRYVYKSDVLYFRCCTVLSMYVYSYFLAVWIGFYVVRQDKREIDFRFKTIN